MATVTKSQRADLESVMKTHPGFELQENMTSGLTMMSYIGDAIIRLWLRKRMASDFGGRSGRPHEDIMNSNEIMVIYAKTMFPSLQGKRVADNFEAYIAWLDQTGQDYNVVLENYYQSYMLTRPKRQKYWHGIEFKCPALRALRQKNRI